jgi:hypothetical protein
MAFPSVAHPAREAVFRFMDQGVARKTRFVVPAFVEYMNKIIEDRTGFGRKGLPLREAASRRLSLGGCLCEVVSARVPLLRGCLCEAAFARRWSHWTEYGLPGT